MVAKCCRRTSSLDHVLSLDRPVKSKGDQMRSQKNEELITVAANGGEAPGALRMLLMEEGVPEAVSRNVMNAARGNEVAGNDALALLE
jgi:hypothetical protein